MRYLAMAGLALNIELNLAKHSVLRDKMFDLFSITHSLLHKAKDVLEKWLIYKADSVNS